MKRYENPEFVKLYSDGASYSEIATSMGVGVRSVESWVTSAIQTGVVVRRRKRKPPVRSIAYSPEVVEKVRQMRNAGVLAEQIAKSIGKSLSTVYGIFIKHKIERPAFVSRSLSPDQGETIKTLYAANVFPSAIAKKIGSSESAVRRFLAANGMTNPIPKARKLTPDKEREMLALWGQKISPTEIARRLDVSRSAIEAKATRLKLPRYGSELRANRTYSHLHSPETRAKAVATRFAKSPKKRPQTVAKIVPVEVIPDGARPWLTRLRGECAYPYGPRGQIHSCCAPTWRETAYCEGHAGLCFEEKKAKAA